MDALICRDLNRIVVLKPHRNDVPMNYRNKGIKSVNIFRLRLWTLYFSQCWQVLKSLHVHVTLYHFNEFIDSLPSMQTSPDISPGTVAEGCSFWSLTASWYPPAMNRCTSLWNLPLFTPVMCVNSADRLPAAMNTERVSATTQGKRGCLREHL